MPNVNILDAANNLIKAASMKRDEKRQLLSEADTIHRDVAKKISVKQLEFRNRTNKVTSAVVLERGTAFAALEARQLKKEMDDLKKFESHKTSELQQAADQLEKQAIQFELEARNLQAQA